MSESEYLEIAIIDLHQFVSEYPNRVLNAFRESSRYTVKETDASTRESEDEYMIHNMVETEDGEKIIAGCIYMPDRQKFQLKIENPSDLEREIEHLRSILGDEEFEELSEIRYSYSRLLSVDEGNVEEFVDWLVDEVEGMGYSVDTEVSSGVYLTGNDAEDVKETTWWFYIRAGDDGERMSPHSFDLHFTEDGIEIRGYVMEGREHADAFRNLLTEADWD